MVQQTIDEDKLNFKNYTIPTRIGEDIVVEKDNDEQQSDNFDCQVSERPKWLNEKMGKNTIVPAVLLKNITPFHTIKEMYPNWYKW